MPSPFARYFRRRLLSLGFTLQELMVVVLILGLLASFGIAQYLKFLEGTRAEEALATLKVVAAANRMFMEDHQGTSAWGTLTDDCNGGACDPNSNAACSLVRCQYLAPQKWSEKAYTFGVSYGEWDLCGLVPQLGVGLPDRQVACAKRCNGASPCTDKLPYKDWGYVYYVIPQEEVRRFHGAP